MATDADDLQVEYIPIVCNQYIVFVLDKRNRYNIIYM